MAQISKKHHYLPQFYVAGFTNKEGNVFVLEHETGIINKQQWNKVSGTISPIAGC